MADSLARIKERGREMACVKMADRIANLQPPPAHWDREKKECYLAEARTIHAELSFASKHLADRLWAKIEAYKAY